MREDIEFDAEGVTLRGWLYLPAGATGPVPTVVMPALVAGIPFRCTITLLIKKKKKKKNLNQNLTS